MWLSLPEWPACLFLPDIYLWTPDVSLTHIVARRVGLNRVLSCQRDAAHGDDYQDAHFEVAEVDHVVTQPPHPRRPQTHRGKHTGTRMYTERSDSSRGLFRWDPKDKWLCFLYCQNKAHSVAGQCGHHSNFCWQNRHRAAAASKTYKKWHLFQAYIY